MSYFIDVRDENLDEGKPLGAAPEGEYRVRIKNWKSDDDGKVVLENAAGNPYLMPQLEITNHPDSATFKDFYHYLGLPNEDMDMKKRNNARYAMAEFFKAFGIDYSQPIDPEATIGREADAIIVVQDDKEYGEGNKVKKFIVGH
jgi:hypothetical protein